MQLWILDCCGARNFNIFTKRNKNWNYIEKNLFPNGKNSINTCKESDAMLK